MFSSFYSYVPSSLHLSLCKNNNTNQPQTLSDSTLSKHKVTAKTLYGFKFTFETSRLSTILHVKEKIVEIASIRLNKNFVELDNLSIIYQGQLLENTIQLSNLLKIGDTMICHVSHVNFKNGIKKTQDEETIKVIIEK